MNIVQALTDPKVLGFAFGADSWRVWRILLAGAFGLPLDAADLETFHRLTGRDPLKAPIRELWAICGRRAGKTSVAAGVVIYLATLKRWTLSAGETGTAMLLASDRDQAKIAFRYCLGLLEASPILSQEIDSPTADSIRLKSGIEIVVATADKAAVRGRTLIAVVSDEISFWGSEADEVLRAVRPGMASQSEAMLVAISTAYAQCGPLFETFRRFYAVPDPRVLVVRAATRDLNAQITQEFIDEELKRDPHAASAEYLSIFRGDISEYLPGDLLDIAIIANRRSVPRADSYVYAAHCDPSGGVSDAMTLAIAHRDRNKVILDKLLVVPPPFNPAETVARFCETLGAYGLRQVRGDRYGAEWVASAFRANGVSYMPSQLSASDCYVECLPLFSQKLVELLDDQLLENELRSLERRVRGGGRGDVIDHGPSQHDDAAAAVCGALLAASKLNEYRAVQSSQYSRGEHLRDYDIFEHDAQRGRRREQVLQDGWGRPVRDL